MIQQAVSRCCPSRGVLGLDAVQLAEESDKDSGTVVIADFTAMNTNPTQRRGQTLTAAKCCFGFALCC